MAEPSATERDRIEKLADSFMTSYRAGQRPSVDAYVQQYPELADQLRGLITALIVLEQNAPHRNRLDALAGNVTKAAIAPREIGEFTIVREIGRGGMGVVYEAVQQSLGRHVALKVLSSGGLMNPVHLERFRLEARSAGRLHHSHIVPVFGVGEHQGLHYYAMQFIPGQSLDQVIEALRKLRPGQDEDKTAPLVQDEFTESLTNGLLTGRFRTVEAAVGNGAASPAEAESKSDVSDRAAPPATPQPTNSSFASHSEFTSSSSGRPFYESVARVGLQVAEALAYAHAEGVLHRDIKPSNLLLDAKGNTWVTDFGLAKAEENEALTETGDFVGTLRYMAPERLEGWSDRRSDIYGLGATLYELLTLRPFFESSSRAQLIDSIRHVQPQPPTKIDPAIPRDLETIVLKALSTEPASRYHTAEAMAEDLRRFLADRPILARRTTPRERFVRWCRRNPAVASLSATVALALVVGTIGAVLAAIQSGRLAEREQELRSAAEQRADAEAKTRKELDQRMYVNRIALAQQELFAQNTGRAQELLDECPIPLRGWEWNFLKRFRPGNPLTFQGGHVGAAFSPDGRYLALGRGFERKNVDIIDPATGRRIRTLLGLTSGVDFYGLAFCPKAGETIVAAGDHFREVVKLWNVETGQEMGTLDGHAPLLWTVEFSPDGQRLAAGSIHGGGKVWDWRTGQVVFELPHLEISRFAYSPDGRHLAVAVWNDDKDVIICEAATGRVIRSFGKHNAGIEGMAYSPNARCLATSGNDGTVKIWDEATGELLRTLRGHTGAVKDVAYTPDGRRLTSAGWDKTVRIWDAETGQETLTLRGHTDIVMKLEFSPNGSLLVSTGEDGVRIWNATPADELTGSEALSVPGHTSMVNSVAFSPDGRLLASAASDRQIKIWDVASLGQGIEPKGLTFQGDTDKYPTVAFSPDSRRLASAGWAGSLKVWDTASAQPLLTIPLQAKIVGDEIRSVAFSPDGRRLASVGPRTLALRDATTGEKLMVVRIPPGDHLSLAYSPDGRFVATCDPVRIWDMETAQEVRSFGHSGGMVCSVAYSSDGQRLASGSFDHSIKIWDTTSWNEIRTLRGHTDRVMSVAFSPDGKRLASGSGDSTVKVWDATSGEEIVTFRGHTGYVWSVAFSPDGSRLASAGGHHNKGEIKVWDFASTLAAVNRPEEVEKARRQTIEFYEMSATAQPKVWEHRCNLGEVYAKLDHWDRAAVEFTEAIRLNSAVAQEIIDSLGSGLLPVENEHFAFHGFFLAMVHWQLGHKDEARTWYDRSVEWMEKHQPKNEELLRFRADAEQLLGITQPSAAPNDVQ